MNGHKYTEYNAQIERSLFKTNKKMPVVVQATLVLLALCILLGILDAIA